MKYVNTLHRQSTVFANVKTGGAYSYHCAYGLKQLCILKEVLSDLLIVVLWWSLELAE